MSFPSTYDSRAPGPPDQADEKELNRRPVAILAVIHRHRFDDHHGSGSPAFFDRAVRSCQTTWQMRAMRIRKRRKLFSGATPAVKANQRHGLAAGDQPRNHSRNRNFELMLQVVPGYTEETAGSVTNYIIPDRSRPQAWAS